MLRPLPTAAVACALALLASVLALPAATAATGDVLTAHWWSGDAAGSHVRTATVAQGTNGGATFRNAYATYISVAPPTGARFESGRRYDAAATRTDVLAHIGQHGYSTCQSSQWKGTIDVHAAAYDETGTLTSFAASYVAECTVYVGGRTDKVAGDLRLADPAPYGALTQTYASEPVAVGHERPTTATLTAVGGGSTRLGAASVVGTNQGDYRVTDNRCAGVTLSDGESCGVTVVFAPQEATGSRPARLVVETPGSLAGAVSVPMSVRAVRVPGAPRALTTYPVQGGVGVTWMDSSPGAETYHLERRLGPDGDWTPLAVVGYLPQRKSHVDREVAPGQQVAYRVTGENSGWSGEPAVTGTTRPTADPVMDATSALGVASTDATSDPLVLRSTDPGTTVESWGDTWPAIHAESTATGTSSVRETFSAPPVPGPGVYRSATPGSVGSLSGSRSELNCAQVESVLQVREVLFAEDLKPLVYDASWTTLCANGTVVRAEIRMGSPRDVTFTTATPASAGPLTTYAGTSVSQRVTLGNDGPLDVDLGAAGVTGSAAEDWRVTEDLCSGTVLRAGATCTLTVSFATAAAGTRAARLEIPLGTQDGPLAPHLVALAGRGAVVPNPVWGLKAHGLLAGVRLYWTKPTDDGGYPVERYDVQRRPLGSTVSWTSVGSTTDVKFYDATVGEAAHHEYRVRAVNPVGGSTWATSDASPSRIGVVVTGETGVDRPRALHLASAVSGWPTAAPMTGEVTHDHADPAVSPGGTRLVYSRSTNPGLGGDGEYDLWRSTVAETFGPAPATPTRLTDLPGAELDAAVSPDASTVAFTRVGANGSSSVWLVPVAGGTPGQLAADAADPAWLPSGEAVVVEDTTGGPLKVVPVDGGAPTPRDRTSGATDPTLSRDGRLAFVDRDGNLAELAPDATAPTIRWEGTSVRRFRGPAYSSSGSLLVTYTTSGGTGLTDRTNNWDLSGQLRQVGEAAPAVRDVYQPSVQIDSITDVAVRGSQQVTFSYHDGPWPDLEMETPHAVLRVDCGLDGVWGACSSPLTLDGLADGKHLLKVRVRDEAGRTGIASSTFVSDTSAPTVRFTAPGGIGDLDGEVTFGWRGEDPHSTVVSYDVGWRKARATGPFSRWRGRSQVTRPAASMRLEQGHEGCLRVRARNRAGYVSPWRTRCVGRPIEGNLLAADPRWRYVDSPPSLALALVEATSAGATLTSRQVTGRRVAVLAQTCPGCGAARVYAGGRLVGRVSTASPRTRSRVWLTLPLLPRAFTGQVRIVTASRAPVRIDGLLVRRT